MLIISSLSHWLGSRARSLSDVMSILCTVHKIRSDGGKSRVVVTMSSSCGVSGGQRSDRGKEVEGEYGADEGGEGMDSGSVSGDTGGCEHGGETTSNEGGERLARTRLWISGIHASAWARVKGGAMMRYWERYRTMDGASATEYSVVAVTVLMSTPWQKTKREYAGLVRSAGTHRDVVGLMR